MTKTSCCGPKPKKEKDACVFANYRTKIDGVPVVFCCEGSANKYMKSKAKKKAKPVKKVAAKKRRK